MELYWLNDMTFIPKILGFNNCYSNKYDRCVFLSFKQERGQIHSLCIRACRIHNQGKYYVADTYAEWSAQAAGVVEL